MQNYFINRHIYIQHKIYAGQSEVLNSVLLILKVVDFVLTALNQVPLKATSPPVLDVCRDNVH